MDVPAAPPLGARSRRRYRPGKAHTGKFVSYLRVSTQRQGHSGLGIEAQRKAVNDFLNGGHWEHVRESVEVESGKRNDRPELQQALQLCRVTGATLVIARIDRLSRNAAFLLSLRDSGVDFVAADMPAANRLTVGIMALVAEQEAELVSKRTREALAAAKARGKKLGNPHGARALRRAGKGNAAAVNAIKRAADEHAERLRPVIEALRDEGITSLERIAAALNRRGMQTPRGGKWHAASVKNLLRRLDARSR